MDVISVLVADDQRLFAESLKTLIERYSDDIKVVGTASNGAEAVEMALDTVPDVVLMDVRMPVKNGVEATREILDHGTAVKVLVLSTFDEDDYVENALRYGASGYLLKDISPTELIASIRAIKEGAIQISPSVATKLVDQIHSSSNGQTAAVRGYEYLSNREKEIFKLITKGMGNSQIAGELHLAEQTVRNYVSTIYSKLNVHDRFQIIQLGNEIRPGASGIPEA